MDLHYFDRMGIRQFVPCRWCGDRTFMSTKECDSCHELRLGLRTAKWRVIFRLLLEKIRS